MDSVDNINTEPKIAKPFDKYSFFLDNKNSPQLNAILTEKITQLGGKIDLFITKNTSCVVTSRPKTERIGPSVETDSPTPKLILNSSTAFSRGKLLLEKTATQAFTQASDTIDLARNFNIRILRSGKLLKFCDEYLDNSKKLKQTTSSEQSTPRKLNPPFIKVVDNSFKYKPNYKELNEWPELNFDYQPELCPFFRAKQVPTNKVANNNNMSQQQLPQANQSQQSNKSTVPTAYKQLNEKCTMLTTPILTGTNTPNITNKSITTNHNQNNRTTTKKKHMTYCEICHKDYSDFESHLIYEKHAKFLENDENFNELIGVINSLPPFIKSPLIKTRLSSNDTNNFEDLTNNQMFNNNDQQKTVCKQRSTVIDDNQKLFGNKKTPSPSMTALHSINAWSSTSKNRSFVAIHDLLNDNKQDQNTNLTHSENNAANQNSVGI